MKMVKAIASNGAADDAEAIALQIGLRYVRDSDPGILRRRCGTGFTYVYETGRQLQSQRHRERIGSLAIPPAWEDVWICRYANGHLQSTGRDSAQRKQYLYHERWQQASNRLKFEGLRQFGALLPDIRRQVDRDLRRRRLDVKRATALAVALLDATAMRIGSREYTRDNESHGLTTLHKRHVRREGPRLAFRFPGKGRKRQKIELVNRRLASQAARFATLSGPFFLQYLNDRTVHALSSPQVNEYLATATSRHVTAKDFRLWGATVRATRRLDRAAGEDSPSTRKRIVNDAIRIAAESLGNTTSVCRRYYVHAGVVEAYLEGRWPDLVQGFRSRTTAELNTDEQKLMHILNRLDGKS